MKSFTILNDIEYFNEIKRDIAKTKAGDRVALMTMSFDPTEPRTSVVMEEMYLAAKRGVHVQLNIDAYCFMITKKIMPSSALLNEFKPESIKNRALKARYGALKKLQNSGGQYCITNIPARRFFNPYAGRSHVKFTVINDTAYIGGCNFGQSMQIDFMVRTNDTETSDWIYKFIMRAAEVGNLKTLLHDNDEVHVIDQVTSLIIDAGVQRQSLIYEYALKCIDEAKEWIFITCQYFPGKETAAHLLKAQKRGVNVTIYFGNTAHHEGLRIPHEFAELRERTKYPKVFFERRINKRLIRLHAKLLATEQGAMIGSHNYVREGVRFGTAESTLYRRDPEFARNVVDAFMDRLAIAEQVAGLR